jgi:hypothetical protein
MSFVFVSTQNDTNSDLGVLDVIVTAGATIDATTLVAAASSFDPAAVFAQFVAGVNTVARITSAVTVSSYFNYVPLSVPALISVREVTSVMGVPGIVVVSPPRHRYEIAPVNLPVDVYTGVGRIVRPNAVSSAGSSPSILIRLGFRPSIDPIVPIVYRLNVRQEGLSELDRAQRAGISSQNALDIYNVLSQYNAIQQNPDTISEEQKIVSSNLIGAAVKAKDKRNIISSLVTHYSNAPKR